MLPMVVKTAGYLIQTYLRPKAADVLQTTGGLIGGLKNHSILASLMIRQADISCPLMTYTVWPQMFNLSL